MQTCAVCTHEYDIDINALMRRYLDKSGIDYIAIDTGEGQFAIDTSNPEHKEVFCEAVCSLIANDIAKFELAELVKSLPATLDEKKQILSDAIRYSKHSTIRSRLYRDIKKHFEDSDLLILEGFVRFRMAETMRTWERCVDHAVEEMLLIAEQKELLELIGSFARLSPASVEQISIILQEDGSCSLTNDMDTHVDYPKESVDSVIDLLISLSPKQIIVYDLSNGKSVELLHTIYRIFEGRVKVYRTVFR
ncbi:MAG TPA: hypothetical protein GXZ61_01025 [Clostridiales bacterium]|jgi:hypothetical protein|nr:hypothetical protein [Clostridiales bacterium]